MDKGGHVVKFI